MNQEVRKLLIDQCVKGEPIYYEVVGRMLGLDLSLPADRLVLSKTLGDISAYEYKNERPLISAIAIYKQKNDHGYGFYNLCEELGIGKASKLSKELYGFTEIEKCKQFWQKKEHYFALATIVDVKINHELDFFTQEEIRFLADWSGKVYDKNSHEHVAAKNYIINSLGTKTQYWSNQLARIIPGMDTFNWRMWSQKGWNDTPNGKIQVARFKHYTWARIYRKGDAEKDIFFTVGVDSLGMELVYKLDYYFEKNSHLSLGQKEIVDKNIPKELRWKSIPVSELGKHDWDSLLDITKKFISEHLQVYDKLIQLAWGNAVVEEVFSNFLRPQEAPANGYSILPKLNPGFGGIEKDYIREFIDKKETGDAGEELVKKYEINRLKSLGYFDLVDEVDIVKDGKGYDVLSFDENRKPKYVEVKTTSGNSLTPFDYTINEMLFAEQHPDAYFIYRLYNYNEENNTADFFVIQNLEASVLMQPVTFRGYIKKKVENT